jgi:hypothetical protein
LPKSKFCECGERVVAKGLCQRCYQRYHRNKGNKEKDKYSAPTVKKYQSLAEVEFIKNYFTHKNWLYQPVIFHLPSGNYTPDFYDAVTGIFIEVVGTRQAFEDNKIKYAEFRTAFPTITLEFKNRNGEMCREDDGKKIRLVQENS